MKRASAPRCMGYGRHSTNKQALTREVQEFRCYDYWERNLKPRDVEWGGFYYDKATTGASAFSERPQGRLLFVGAVPGDHVVVAKLDRSFRSLRDGLSVMDQFHARGVIFHSLDLMIDTSTPLGKFFRTVVLAVAELERDFTSERVKDTISLRKREGRPYGKGCPVGWKVIGRKPHRSYRVDQDERILVDAMAQCRVGGMSYDDIALWCMRQKVSPGAKRPFPTRDQVKWAIMARAAGYPKIAGYKRFIQMVRSGEIALRLPK
jgi:DNA invertase Pin-like site-specific DNA recombinase